MPTSNRDEQTMIDLDIHTHLAPINADRLKEFDGVQWDEVNATLTLDGGHVRMPGLFEPQRLIEWMDKHGVKRSLVSIPPPLYRQSLSLSESLRWVRYVNEELLNITQASNGRLGTLFYVPLEHSEAIPELLEECGKAPYEGVALSAGGHPDIIYSAPRYLPLWAWLNAHKSLTFIHPGACGDARLTCYYLENLLGNPYETAVAATHLTMANVPACFPEIKFCLAHAGGLFPAVCGRLEAGFKTGRPGVPLESERPLQAARHFYADCIAHSPSVLRLAQNVFGEDHILFGSDWPFPMGIQNPIQT
jgi:aminocarboxymuconate-semialdehyde decarboxylase